MNKKKNFSAIGNIMFWISYYNAGKLTYFYINKYIYVLTNITRNNGYL